MSFVRTVLGDIDPEGLGFCYAHEHLAIVRSYTTEKTPDFLLDDVEGMAKDLAEAKAGGGLGWCVDSMPGGGAGRSPAALRALSEKAGVPIVCPTGLHLRKYYPEGHWGPRASQAELQEVFVWEIERGVDVNDLAGPTYRPMDGVRAGVIKVAGGRDALDEYERRLFRAAAGAQRVTGCPILTHAEEGTAGLEQARLLIDSGADPGHIVLSHLDRVPDAGYHREVLRTGVRLEYDSAFRWKAGETNHTEELLVELLPEFPGQLMLGMDAARRKYWRCYGGSPGIDFLATTFVPRLRRRGLAEELLTRLTMLNGREAYQFAEVNS